MRPGQVVSPVAWWADFRGLEDNEEVQCGNLEVLFPLQHHSKSANPIDLLLSTWLYLSIFLDPFEYE